MPKIDDVFYNDVTVEQQKLQDEKIDKAITDFLTSLEGVDRTSLLQALHQIEIMSNDVCVVRVPKQI